MYGPFENQLKADSLTLFCVLYRSLCWA